MLLLRRELRLELGNTLLKLGVGLDRAFSGPSPVLAFLATLSRRRLSFASSKARFGRCATAPSCLPSFGVAPGSSIPTRVKRTASKDTFALLT